MAEATERQVVVKHFGEKKKAYSKPVDLALDMKEVQVRKRELTDNKYLGEVLKAGYKSPLFTELHKDVVAAQKAAFPKKEEAKK